jgi:hypothetical protein
MAIVITLIVFAVTLVQAPLQSGEWYWDSGNALGFLGYAGLLYLFIDVGFSRRQRVHQLISYAVTTTLVAHAAWLWIPDATIWHYLVWDGPAYMLAGCIALLLVLCIPVLALPGSRRKWHINHFQFKRWHYWLSVGSIMASYWHMVGSGFYLSDIEAVLLGLGTLAILSTHHWKALSPTEVSRLGYVIIVSAPVFFVLLKGLAT